MTNQQLTKIKLDFVNLIPEIIKQFPKFGQIYSKIKPLNYSQINFATVNQISISKIKFETYNIEVCERFIALYNEILKKIFTDNLTIGVFNVYRSLTDQFELWLKGRYISGDIITKALPGESMHNYGCAVDFVFYIKNKGWSWDSKLNWKLIQNTAKQFEFKVFDWDKPHVELQLPEIIEIRNELVRFIAKKIKEFGLNPLLGRQKIPNYLKDLK